MRHAGGGAGESREPPPTPTVRLNGIVEVTGADGVVRRVAGRQAQAVLAYLLIEQRPVPRDDLADLLWGDRPLADHWAGAVRGVLTKVRAVLVAAGVPGDRLVVEAGMVELRRPPSLTTDLEVAAGFVERVERALVDGDPERALDSARAATAALGSGPFLAAADGDWVRFERERVAGLAVAARHHEIAALLALGHPSDAARSAAEQVRADALDEPAHNLLIRSLVADGRRAEAVAAYNRFAEVLEHELGISPSEATAALVDGLRGAAPAAEPDRRPAALRPAPTIVGRPPGRFVGRRPELAHLADAWDDVVERRAAQVVVVGGQTGVGKTRLAREAADRAAAAGGCILWTRCRATSGLAFEPVAEALRIAVADDPSLVARLGPLADGLVDLVPALGGGRPRPQSTGDPTVARDYLFRSAAAAVAQVAERPTVWVVDDLQWASEDTVALVEMVLDELERPLLVVATCRNQPPFVDAALARLQRAVSLTTITLGGFSEDDLVRLVAGSTTAASAEDRELAHTLLDRTAGHPFLVTEIDREGRRRGGLLDPSLVPDSVRDWIGRRAAALARPVAACLDLAVTVGIDVDLDLLTRCSAEPVDVVLDRCEELVQHGLLVDVGAGGTFAFPHVLTRDVVYERMGPTRRIRLHRRVADAIADGPDAEGRSAALAHHYSLAGPASRLLAASHGLAAGQESLARSAWALAADQLEAALDLATPDADLRARTLVELGRARHGNRDLLGAREALEEAVALATAAELPGPRAEAVALLVGRAGRGAALGISDDERIALLRGAIGAFDRPPPAAASMMGPQVRSSLLVRLEGELALALLLTDAVEERTALAERTLQRVRAAADPDPNDLALALLSSRVTTLHPDRRSQRLANLDEILALPPGAVSLDVLITALCNRHEERLTLGQRGPAHDDLHRARELADRYRHPYWQWTARTWQVLDHIVDGDLEAAEQAAVAAASLQLADQGESAACLGVNLVDIRLFQGRAGEVVDMLADAADRVVGVPCYRAVLALCCAESGRLDESQAALDHFSGAGFANLPDDTNRFLGLAVLADAAVTLGDAAAGRALEPLLAPYAEMHVVLTVYGGGGSYWGPASHQLARLAALDGRLDDAARLLADAHGRAEELGAPLAARRIVDDEHRLL